MIKGKSINLFLMDGEPSSRIKCTLQNWTGIVYKIPRTMLENCKEGSNDIVKHLKQTGIYFLLGEDLNSGQKAVYVGQAVARKNGDGLLCRLLEHKRNLKEKYWADWNEVIVLTTQNNSFGPTEISYLENKFTNLARSAGRYLVKNGNEPNVGNFTEEKESELLEYIDYAQIIIGVLGHMIFEPLLKDSKKNSKKSPVFSFKGKLKAEAIFTNEGFVVLKGSQIDPSIKPSMSNSAIKAREINREKISQDFVLMEDILFTSPSAAAGFVGGSSLSGNELWKTKDNKSPKDFNF